MSEQNPQKQPEPTPSQEGAQEPQEQPVEGAQAPSDTDPQAKATETVQGIPGGSTVAPTIQEVGGQPAHLAQTDADQRGYIGETAADRDPESHQDPTLAGRVQANTDDGTTKADQDANLQQ